MYTGPGETRLGWLMLTLTLDKILDPDEHVTHVFNSTVLSISSWWLVVTSERLLSLPAHSVIFFDRLQRRSYRLSEISDLKSRSIITGSRASFRVGGEKTRYPLKGRKTAAALIEALPAAARKD
jgi:hypothetical protein